VSMSNLLILPLPPSNNQLRIPTNRGGFVSLIKSQECRDWEEICGVKWLEYSRANRGFWSKDTPTKTLQFKYNMEIFLKDYRKDISNFEKAILDFLKGKLFTDDHFVKLNLKMPVLADPNKKGYVVIDCNPDIFRV